MIALISISCSGDQKRNSSSTEVAGTPERQIQTGMITSVEKNDLHYSYYIPSNGGKNLPALIFFDPQGKGHLPLEKYQALSEEFKIVLIGSNDCKNGMGFEATTEICKKLIDEAVNYLGADVKQLSLAGFSGGAKVALVNGINLPGIHSIIASGAALPPGSTAYCPPVLGFAGFMDMNYTEVISFLESLPEDTVQHALVEWKGKHEWPDSITFRHAFYWALLSGNGHAELLSTFLKETEGNLSEEKSASVRMNLMKEFTALAHGSTDENRFKDAITKLEKSQDYLKEKNKQRNDLTREENEKKIVSEAFSSKDLNWWRTKIQSLQKEQTPVSKRLLGYISLASFSYANRALSSNNPFALRMILEIYRLADPENSEHAFLRAKMYMMNGQKDSASISLKEALKLGADRERIENEFPSELLK